MVYFNGSVHTYAAPRCAGKTLLVFYQRSAATRTACVNGPLFHTIVLFQATRFIQTKQRLDKKTENQYKEKRIEAQKTQNTEKTSVSLVCEQLPERCSVDARKQQRPYDAIVMCKLQLTFMLKSAARNQISKKKFKVILIRRSTAAADGRSATERPVGSR